MPTYYLLSCQHCNSEFNVLPRNKTQLFCSADCRNLSKRKHHKETNCLQCGMLLNRGQYKFCSKSCAASYNNKGVRRRGKSLEEKARPCCICNKTIYRGKYCSITCRSIGKTKYTPEELKEHRRQVNKIAQHNWRAKYNRKLSPDANSELVSYIIKNCPAGWEVDHIIPLSKGGEHHESNLQYLPAEENRSKGYRRIYSAVNREYSVREVVREFFELK